MKKEEALMSKAGIDGCCYKVSTSPEAIALEAKRELWEVIKRDLLTLTYEHLNGKLLPQSTFDAIDAILGGK